MLTDKNGRPLYIIGHEPPCSGRPDCTCGSARIVELEEEISRYGYAVRYVEWCEDDRTPGLLGQIRGVTDRALREVKVSARLNDTIAAMVEVLEHEARHVREPSWDCGNRDVLGRGGQR